MLDVQVQEPEGTASDSLCCSLPSCLETESLLNQNSSFKLGGLTRELLGPTCLHPNSARFCCLVGLRQVSLL